MGRFRMSAVIHVEVEGLEETLRNLREFPVGLDEKVQDAVLTVANRMLETAQRLAPIRTGYLRSTIGIEPSGRWSFNLYARAFYAPYVEWGTWRMQAHLFMTRAFQRHQAELAEETQNAVASAITDTFH
jgi:HK97 gp10 family phage protein